MTSSHLSTEAFIGESCHTKLSATILNSGFSFIDYADQEDIPLLIDTQFLPVSSAEGRHVYADSSFRIPDLQEAILSPDLLSPYIDACASAHKSLLQEEIRKAKALYVNQPLAMTMYTLSTADGSPVAHRISDEFVSVRTMRQQDPDSPACTFSVTALYMIGPAAELTANALVEAKQSGGTRL